MRALEVEEALRARERIRLRLPVDRARREGPRELGHNHLDLNIKDPHSPSRIARFFQVGDQVYIENLCGDKATINNANFDQHLVYPGDILRVASSVIELSILA